MPIMLIRNTGPHLGLCNGTRLIVKGLHNKLIEAEIAFGAKKRRYSLYSKDALNTI